jgi:iron complex outermembrane receptor protein
MRTVVWFYIFWVFSLYGYAQSEKIIYGKILNEESQPIEGAYICIEGTSICTQSDSLGKYQLKHICKDSCKVVCLFLGYEKTVRHVHLSKKTQCDFILHHISTNEIHVFGEEKETYQTYPTDQLNTIQLDALRYKSLSEQLATLPGVRTLKTGATISKPVLHGLYGYRVLMLQHGVRLEGQQWGNEHAPEIDPFLASEIRVLKGANAVRYGSDAMSGVILIEPAPVLEITKQKIQLYNTFQTQNRQNSLCGILENKLSKSLKYRIQGTGIIAGSSKTPEYYLANTAFHNYNGSVALGYIKEKYDAELFYSYFYNKIGIFSGAHIGNLTDLQLAFERDKPYIIEPFTYTIQRPYQNIQHHFAKYRMRYASQYGDFALTIAYQNNDRQEFDAHNTRNSQKAELDLTIQTTFGELLWKHKPLLNKQLQGTAGMSGMYQYNVFAGSRYFIPEYFNETAGIFWTEHYQKKKIEMETGIRYDFRTVSAWIWKNNIPSLQKYQFNAPSAMLGIAYIPHPHWKASANVSTAWRMPAMNELFVNGVHHGTASYEIGNPDLKTEQGIKAITAVSYQNHEKTTVECSSYYHHIQNFIYLKPTLDPVLTVRGAFPAYVYEQNGAYLYGTDIRIQQQIRTKYTLRTQYSLVRGWNTALQTHLPLIPADNFQLTIDYNTVHKVLFMDNIIFNFGGQYIFKQIRYMSGTELPVPNAYYLLQASIQTSVSKHLFIQIQIDNLLNKKYRDYLNRFRYFSDETGRNLVFSVKYVF